MDPSPPLPLNVIIGPILLGSLLNWCFFGVLGVQTYLYFQWYPKDRNVVKSLVVILLVLDTSQTVVSTINAWTMLISGWGNVEVLFAPPWSLCMAVILSGLISAIVQIFFARRVWILSKSIPVSLFIVAVSLTQCVSAITGSIQVWVPHNSSSTLLATFKAFAIWLSCSLACDLMIAVSLVYYLIQTNSKTLRSADALITRLINNSIQSGSITAVCAGVDLFLFLKFRNNNLHDVPFLMLGKLYSNTLLANLNARSSFQLADNLGTYTTGTVLTDPIALAPWVPDSIGDSREVYVRTHIPTGRDTVC
ncbi:hypothetical protein K439DRAFT_389447 [Ramaria rubella]|nr:hypothetical protein K439DRAFT_389447 [Ramaria rubella]